MRDERKQPTPIHQPPNEQDRKPVDYPGLYQRYWEEKDRQRRRDEAFNDSGLNIYERARGEFWRNRR